jgi:hypothetical protein
MNIYRPTPEAGQLHGPFITIGPVVIGLLAQRVECEVRDGDPWAGVIVKKGDGFTTRIAYFGRTIVGFGFGWTATMTGAQ